MTKRAKRLGLESGSIRADASEYDNHPSWQAPFESEIAHSIAISLRRIADALDGTALGVDVSQSVAALNITLRNQP